jgi:hypothetical protein
LTITKENTIENIIRVIGLWLKKCGDSALFWFAGADRMRPARNVSTYKCV